MDYEHSVFVSYPHVLNEPYERVDHGWVTYFIRQLKKSMSGDMGKKVKIWLDNEDLRGNDNIAQTIENALHNSATLLIVLSEAYLRSDWCKREMNTFAQQDCEKRVFVVEYKEMNHKKLPPFLANIRRYPFWEKLDDRKIKVLGLPQPDPDKELIYYEKIEELSSDICKQLKLIENEQSNTYKDSNNEKVDENKSNQKHSPTKNELKIRKPIILLDKPPFRLQETHKKIKLYLESRDYIVLSNKKLSPKKEADFFIKCDLFVQLLDCYPDDEEKQWAEDKLELAKNNKVKIIQWRNPKKNIHSISDAKYKKFLNADTVRATGLQEFVKQIIQIIRDNLPELSNQKKAIKEAKIVSVIGTKDCTCMNNFCQAFFHNPNVEKPSQPLEKIKDLIVLSHGTTAKKLIKKYSNYQILDGQHFPTIIKEVAREVDNV